MKRLIALFGVMLIAAVFAVEKIGPMIKGLWPPWGGGGGGSGVNVSTDISGNREPIKPPPPTPPVIPRQMTITIDDNKYLVDGRVVERLDDIIKRAVAVPKDGSLCQVKIIREGTSRFTAEKNLTDSLDAANVSWDWEFER